MNLIFGAIGDIAFEVNEELINNYLRQNFNQTAVIACNGPPQVLIGHLDNGGVILGKAESSKASLYLLGNIYKPLPDWEGNLSPLDNPDKVVAYLLERYENIGEAFLDHLTGQYSVLLLDHNTESLYLATDPSGMRSWYIAKRADGLLFSTNLGTLAKMLGDRLSVDRSQEDFFLIYGFYPNNGTPYQGVTSMPSGALLKYRQKEIKKQKISYSNPWKNQPRFKTDDIESLDTLIDQLYDAFMSALEEQSADDKKAAVLLGGFDSALVASALHRLGKVVETFSFWYKESHYNQPHVDILAQYLNIKHNWIQITQDIFSNGLQNFSQIFNQPTNWPNYVIQTAYLCKIMRKAGFHFCYSGDGCDTVFLGYPGTYKRAVLLESLPTLPQWLVNFLIDLFGWKFLERSLGHPYRVILNLLRSLGRDMPARGFVSFRIMDEISLKQLRRDNVPEQAMSIEQLLRELSEPFRNLPTLRLAYHGKSLVSPNKNKMVGSSDQCGIAIFSPYLHPGLKAFASTLPESLCRPNEETPSSVTGKYVLMKMAEKKQLLPREVIYQRKVAGVDGPIDEWYAGPLNNTIMELLKDLPFVADQKYLRQLARQKIAEDIFKNKIMTDKVISHALSLLITYASFTREVGSRDNLYLPKK